MDGSNLLHELVLSIIASDGFYMIRYLKNKNSPITEGNEGKLDQTNENIGNTNLAS